MTYVGIQSQIRRNNTNCIILIVTFPLVLLGMVYAFMYFTNMYFHRQYEEVPPINDAFISTMPVILICVGIWFVIAWFFHTYMIQYATDSKPLERRENMRVYNLVENLCISQGMKNYQKQVSCLSVLDLPYQPIIVARKLHLLNR